ncbi:MAG TPA: ABC transporter permease [Candidatus Acidoferrales bacterium]|nr:ABC transporter permease [Candidatus Acidoferrales bacterium]
MTEHGTRNIEHRQEEDAWKGDGRRAMVGMRRFWSNVAAVAYKESTVVRHDKALLATVFAQPVMMLLLFGLALSNKPANVPWVVLDRSQTAMSRRLIEEIHATGYFLPPRSTPSYDSGRASLQNGDALAFLVIPSTFRRDVERGRPQVELMVDGADPLSSARISGYIGQVAAAFQTRPQPVAQTSDSPPTGLVGPIDVRQRFWFNSTLRDRDFFLVALAGMLLTNLCLSATSLGLVGERENGTFEQMLSLPTSPMELLIGKLVPYAGLSYLVLTFATLASGLGFGIWPRGSWIALYVVTLPFILASLSIGIFVSTLARTSAQAVFITVFFILPSFVLSGSMFPYQLMPHGVREIGGLLPLRWYQIALRCIEARGGGWVEVAVPTLALIAIFAVIISAARWRMKPRLG